MTKKIFIKILLGITLTFVMNESSAMKNYMAQKNKIKINKFLNYTIKKRKLNDIAIIEITINQDGAEKKDQVESFVIPLHTIDLVKQSKRKINQQRDSESIAINLFLKKHPKIVLPNNHQIEEINLFDS